MWKQVSGCDVRFCTRSTHVRKEMLHPKGKIKVYVRVFLVRTSIQHAAYSHHDEEKRCAGGFTDLCLFLAATHVINASLVLLTMYITDMQRAFLEYDSAFIDAMEHSTKHTHGD